MARLLVNSAIGILAASLLAACGTPGPPLGAASMAPRGPAGSPVAASPIASPTRGAPLATATAPGPRPTVDVATDPMAQRALADARERRIIRSGTPIVRLSRPVTPDELADLGFGTWNFTPGCVPPLHLVILQGDFDWRGAYPDAAPADQASPVKFIIFIYDLKLGVIRSIGGDPNGAWVKKALGDPTLPTVDPAALPHISRPVQVPCNPTVLPGGPTPPPTQP